DAEHGKATKRGATVSFKAAKVTKPKAAKATKPASDPKPKPPPTQPPKSIPEKKQKLVQETPDEPSPAKRSRISAASRGIRKRKKEGHTPMPAEASGPAESPSLDAKLALTDSKTESDDEENLKQPSEDPVISEEPASSTRTLSSLQNLKKELSFTNQFFMDKQQEKEPGKTNAEAEVQSMVAVLIHQDTSSVPPMNTLVIDLTTDLPAVDMKEILQQRMFEDKSYKAHEDHKKLYDALEKSLERDYSDQLLLDLEKARQKKRKRRASGSSQLPLPPPPPSTRTSGSAQQQGNKAPIGLSGTQELSLTDSLIRDDSIPDKQAHLSDDEDSENDHLPTADSRKGWWKPLPAEERPVTPEPTWTIPSSNTGYMTNFLNWYCRQVNKTKLTQADLEGQAYEVVKAFYLDVIHLQFQMKECHKLLTDQVDWTNPEGDQVSVDVNRPLPLSGPPGHVTIQSQFFFNKDLEYLRHCSNGSNPTLSISKMKAASYHDFGLELLVLEQMWIKDVCTYDISANYGISHWWLTRQKFYIDRHDSPLRQKEVRSNMRILNVVRIK
nr:hypothetical protein [Tanacetum cinerariifolium]